MRIMIAAPRIAVDDSIFNQWTGLDLVIRDLADGYRAAGNQICVVTPHLYKFSDGSKCPDWCYQRKTWLPLLPPGESGELLRILTNFGAKAFARRLRTDLFYRWMQSAVQSFDPEVIHVHSSTYWASLAVQVASRNNVPAVITLHGVNATNPVCGADVKCDEEDLLGVASRAAFEITAVSSGTAHIMEKIEDGLRNKVRVIPNGSRLEPYSGSADEARLRYGIPNTAKVIVCIGTIGVTKNQEMLIEAFGYLPINIRRNLRLVIVGRDASGGRVREAAHSCGVENEVIFTGYVDSVGVSEVLSIASLNVVASKSEGFGLSIVEAMRAGVPSLVYEKIDAYEDFKQLYSVTSFPELSARCLTDYLLEELSTPHDANLIMAEGRRFGLDSIVKEYLTILSSTKRNQNEQ